MTPFAFAPIAAQGAAMIADEGWFHRKRGLGRWERVGHPLDTLTVAACYAWLLFHSPGDRNVLPGYIALAALSCIFVTKDEFVHAKHCAPAEHWLHAILFVLHPLVFLAFWTIWAAGGSTWVLQLQLSLTLGFCAYQVGYWSVRWA
jgi:hypothetical protein